MGMNRNETLRTMIATAKRLGFYCEVSRRGSRGEQRSMMFSSPSPNDAYAVNVCNDGRWTYFEFKECFVPVESGQGQASLEAFIAKRFDDK